MLIPIRTDAPVYHRPVATVCLIALNVAVFVAQLTEAIDPFRWALDRDSVQPLQWVSSNFIHGGIFHLLGNEYIERFPESSDPMRLRLATIEIRRNRQPTRGSRLLGTVSRDFLSTDDAALYDDLVAEAERLREEQPLEFADDDES